ncbi:MAG: membrane protein of unknown function [Promethearchaeota archaeon]|nr:MAG: membrane protein of unknown function [Candidatus Lokiarchaeota archaeon]
MNLKDSLNKFLEALIEYIGIIMLISGGVIVIGTLISFSVATIDIIFTKADLAFNPLFGEMIVKAYVNLPGIYSAVYTFLFTSAIPSSLNVLAMIILIVGAAIAIFGLLEMLKERVGFLGFLKDKSMVIPIIYIALSGAATLFSLILFFVFMGELLEGLQTLYVFFEVSLFSNAPLLSYFVLSSVATPSFGFYMIAIPAFVLVLISILFLIMSMKGTPAPTPKTTTSSTSTA